MQASSPNSGCSQADRLDKSSSLPTNRQPCIITPHILHPISARTPRHWPFQARIRTLVCVLNLSKTPSSSTRCTAPSSARKFATDLRVPPSLKSLEHSTSSSARTIKASILFIQAHNTIHYLLFIPSSLQPSSRRTPTALVSLSLPSASREQAPWSELTPLGTPYTPSSSFSCVIYE